MLSKTNVILTPFTPNHITPEYINWINDPSINRYIEMGRIPVVQSEVFVPNSDDVIMFAIILKRGNKYIGTTTLHNIDMVSKKAEVGYMIGDLSECGKGYATEVVELLVRFAFNSLGLNKIHARVLEDNIGSIKALEKNNFVRYGIEPQAYYLENKYLNDCLFYRKL